MSGMTYQQAYEQYAGYVETCIACRVRNLDARKDIEQDTWLKAWRAWPDSHQENIKAWLCRIAVNTAYDYLRKQRIYATCSLENVMEEYAFDFAADGPSIEEQCELMDLLRSMLDSPHGDLVRLVIASTQALSGKELAEHYGITPDMAKTRVYRARLAIRERFAKEVA